MKKYKKMVTTFNKKDMVSFGNYLLSNQRKQLFKNHPEKINDGDLEQRLSEVHHADFENWLSYQNEFKNVSVVGQMCLESLDPEEFEAWEKVRAGLMRSRRSLSGKY